jgi:hypothetical protein
MNNDLVPPELLKNISDETIDFVVNPPRAQPRSVSLFILFFSLFWLGFTSILFFVLIRPALEPGYQGNSVQNPAIVVGIFTFIGLCLLIGAFSVMLRKGGYFIGTPTRLIHFKKGKIKSVEWNAFTGEIEVEGTNKKRTVTMSLNSGRMITRENTKGRKYDHFIKDTIEICDIHGAFDVEEYCRKRIKENNHDKNPSVASDAVGDGTQR